jgi:Holliday junction resolvase RusA-like endonuclease
MKKDKPFTYKWELTIPAIPPTLNHCTRRGKNNRYFPSPQYEAFQELVLLEMRNGCSGEIPVWPPDAHLWATITISSPRVYCKTGKRKGELNETFGDLDNFIKPLIDAVFKPLDRNDAYIMRHNAGKTYAEKDETVLLIEWLA